MIVLMFGSQTQKMEIFMWNLTDIFFNIAICCLSFLIIASILFLFLIIILKIYQLAKSKTWDIKSGKFYKVGCKKAIIELLAKYVDKL